jgi:alkylhydroperoxidase family enzyme
MAHIRLPEGSDTEQTRMWELAPDLYKAAGSFTKTMYAGRLSVRERELARMRIAEINACPI